MEPKLETESCGRIHGSSRFSEKSLVGTKRIGNYMMRASHSSIEDTNDTMNICSITHVIITDGNLHKRSNDVDGNAISFGIVMMW